MKGGTITPLRLRLARWRRPWLRSLAPTSVPAPSVICSLACFELDEFESALAAFKEAQRLDTAGALDRKIKTCIRKCEAEMEGSSREGALPAALAAAREPEWLAPLGVLRRRRRGRGRGGRACRGGRRGHFGAPAPRGCTGDGGSRCGCPCSRAPAVPPRLVPDTYACGDRRAGQGDPGGPYHGGRGRAQCA